ncbi:hypothetical protein [Methyloversatilis universalis]|nr:hypothetical protein [Methyloversatilis universalis]
MDYAIFFRRAIAIDRLTKELGKYDVFVSAYNSSDRVQRVFSEVRASRKIWLVHPEYQYTAIDLPDGYPTVLPADRDELVQVDALLSEIGTIGSGHLCIDITGFMRHTLAFLLPKLLHAGIGEFTALYSEPVSYSKQEATQFSTTTSGSVRPVRGMYGSPGAGKDHLVMAIGYDHKLISEVSAYKDGVITHPLFAFPSLSADMYQQSAVRAEKSGDIVLKPEWVSNRLFAPANDPFATAGVVSELVRTIDTKGVGQNIYLSPLSTKPQVLGMSLFWLLEGQSRGRCSLLLPECVTYSRETSTGLRRLWKYRVELT